MEIETIRHVSSGELADYRRGLKKGARRVVVTRSDPRYVSHAVDSVEGSTAHISTPGRTGVRRGAHEVRDALMQRRLAGLRRLAKKDPAWFVQFAQHVRQQNPTVVAHMTDEEVVTTVWARMHEEATQQAFKALGRDVAVIG